MKIIKIKENPIYRFPCVIVAPGGRRQLKSFIPVLNVIVDDLPGQLEAIYAGSDFQAYDKLEVPAKDRKLMGEVIGDELVLMSDTGLIPRIQNSGMILAGDLYADPKLINRGGYGNVDHVWESYFDFKWLTGVAGNHDKFKDRFSIAPYLSETVLDGSIQEFSDLRIGGVSGIVGKQGKAWRRPLKKFIGEVEYLINRGIDMLVLHEGPWVPELNGDGNRLLRSFLETLEKELMVLSGHRHWQDVYFNINQFVQAVNLEFRLIIFTKEELAEIGS